MSEVWLEVVEGSAAIDRIGYDPARHELLVRFTSGEAYVYRDVPEDMVVAFLQAESKGGFFQAGGLGRYGFERMT